jgi:cytochrome P450
VKLPADRRLDRALGELRSILDGFIARARIKLDAIPEAERRPDNFLEAMLVARDDDGQPFSDQVIFGNVLTMLLAGEDTTAHSLSWVAHEILDQPEVRKKLVREIDATLGEAAVPCDVDTANRLPYVDAVATETLRLRAVAPYLALESNEDVVVGDVAVPRGTWVYVLMRLPAIQDANFGDAASFRPERWLEGGHGAHVPSAYTPFGSGPRICPGRSLALLEMRVVLATLLRSFELERVGSREQVEEQFSFTVVPKNIAVRLHRRAAAP